VPKVDAERAMALYRALAKAIREGLVASCHDCSDGGLGVALAETAFSGGLGMNVDLAAVCAGGISRDDEMLFSESQSRFVVTVRPEKKAAFEAMLAGSPFACVGTVTAEGLFRVKGLRGGVIVEEKIEDLKEAWQRTLRF
jgi:phosphoribosylformylglycinamidine synthase